MLCIYAQSQVDHKLDATASDSVRVLSHNRTVAEGMLRFENPLYLKAFLCVVMIHQKHASIVDQHVQWQA